MADPDCRKASFGPRAAQPDATADRLAVARRRLADPIDIALNGNPYADTLTEILALCDQTIWILNATDVRAVFAKHLGDDV